MDCEKTYILSKRKKYSCATIQRFLQYIYQKGADEHFAPQNTLLPHNILLLNTLLVFPIPH
jgi:hypothetical protein